jgi:hypothetical protein
MSNENVVNFPRFDTTFLQLVLGAFTTVVHVNISRIQAQKNTADVAFFGWHTRRGSKECYLHDVILKSVCSNAKYNTVAFCSTSVCTLNQETSY